ncbi:hypothetical protein [Massilia phyllosphaerae]|uniref:hypothetical protein n=1 Tax=Massilia phyllosphaerae TaxID=3106034 RepID=UPI002B1CDC6B|nr:hypothetical protein [Massilia sp. SGZ-792]
MPLRAVADFIAVKDGNVIIGEVKDGLGAKLTPFQKTLFASDEALGRLAIASEARRVGSIVAGKTIYSQLSMGARLSFTLEGTLTGRAGRQIAARVGGLAACAIVRVVFTLPLALWLGPDI